MSEIVTSILISTYDFFRALKKTRSQFWNRSKLKFMS